MVAPLTRLRASSDHTLAPGATASELDEVARDLRTALPASYRAVLSESNGMVLCRGLVTFWSTHALVDKNGGLRSYGWFDDRHIFIAESATEQVFALRSTRHTWGPDFFFIDVTEGDDPAVRAFNLTPTRTGVAARSVSAWIELVLDTDGFGAPPDHGG